EALAGGGRGVGGPEPQRADETADDDIRGRMRRGFLQPFVARDDTRREAGREERAKLLRFLHAGDGDHFGPVTRRLLRELFDRFSRGERDDFVGVWKGVTYVKRRLA